jgi:hypothetical protein
MAEVGQASPQTAFRHPPSAILTSHAKPSATGVLLQRFDFVSSSCVSRTNRS